MVSNRSPVNIFDKSQPIKQIDFLQWCKHILIKMALFAAYLWNIARQPVAQPCVCLMI